MMDYLQPKDGPVIEGREHEEVVYAKNQPEYKPLRCLVVKPEGRVTSRWTFTEEQRKAVAEGADLFLTLLTFGQPLQPILMAIEKDPCEFVKPKHSVICSYWMNDPCDCGLHDFWNGKPRC